MPCHGNPGQIPLGLGRLIPETPDAQKINVHAVGRDGVARFVGTQSLTPEAGKAPPPTAGPNPSRPARTPLTTGGTAPVNPYIGGPTPKYAKPLGSPGGSKLESAALSLGRPNDNPPAKAGQLSANSQPYASVTPGPSPSRSGGKYVTNAEQPSAPNRHSDQKAPGAKLAGPGERSQGGTPYGPPVRRGDDRDLVRRPKGPTQNPYGPGSPRVRPPSPPPPETPPKKFAGAWGDETWTADDHAREAATHRKVGNKAMAEYHIRKAAEKRKAAQRPAAPEGPAGGRGAGLSAVSAGGSFSPGLRPTGGGSGPRPPTGPRPPRPAAPETGPKFVDEPVIPGKAKRGTNTHWSDKDLRRYAHIRDAGISAGKPTAAAKRIAAATVNKGK